MYTIIFVNYSLIKLKHLKKHMFQDYLILLSWNTCNMILSLAVGLTQ